MISFVSEKLNAMPETRRHLLLLAVFSAVLCLPLLMGGFTRGSADAVFLVMSYKGFIAGLLDGEFYPRWADNFYNGYGAPIFYFYPPLSFYLPALIDALSFFTLPVEYILGLAAAIVILLSAFAAYAWLGDMMSRQAALAGAMVYAAAPYHYLIDVYVRGSYSEPMAYIGLPLALLCIRKIRKKGALAGLALAYAGIICSSMSMAIAVTPFLLAYAAFENRTKTRELVSCIAGLLAGAGLSGIYLVPAVFMFEHIEADTIWSGYFDPRNWFLCFTDCSRAPSSESLLYVSVIAAMQMIVLAVLFSDSSRGFLSRAEKMFWAFCTGAAFFMMTSASEFLWEWLPVLKKIQFPWRLMIFLDLPLALLTGLAVASFLAKKTGKKLHALLPGLYILGLAGAVIYGLGLAMPMMKLPPRPDYDLIVEKGIYFNVYIPAGVEKSYGDLPDKENFDEVVLEKNKKRQILDYSPVAHGKKFKAESNGPALIHIHDYYFPTLNATSLETGERYRLEQGKPAGEVVLHYTGGANTIILRLEKNIWEKIGLCVSLLSAGLLVLGRINRAPGRQRF